jgi:hypothetical protein
MGAVAACWLLGGCSTGQRRPEAAAPVFFPPAPEKPRLQFLKSFSGPADLGVAGPSGLEKFILGQTKETTGLVTPYGLAFFDEKLYVCDVGQKRIQVLDLGKRSFGYMTEDRRLVNPVNIAIEEDGMKYVADPTAGAVFVFDRNDALRAMLGKELQINPIDVAVRGPHCYVTDFASNRVVVLDKATGQEIRRLGEQGDGEKQFKLISDLTVGPEGDVYVTDKIKAKIFQFDPSGTLKRTIGRLGDSIDELVRPKGIAVDDDHRIWVVDAGVSVTPNAWSTEVAKIYDREGRLLLFFGQPGNEPGRMNLPAKIVLDRRHVSLFQRYAVPGAQIEFLVLVSNQYGPHKISVYGFGEFPGTKEPKDMASKPVADAPGRPQEPAPKEPVEKEGRGEPSAPTPPRAKDSPPLPSCPAEPSAAQPAPAVEPPVDDAVLQERIKVTAELYLQSMKSYRAGDLTLARTGFLELSRSDLIPPAVQETLRGYIQDIDRRLAGERGGQP